MKGVLSLEKSILLVSGLHCPLIEAGVLWRKGSALKQMLVNGYRNTIGGTIAYLVRSMQTVSH